MTTVHVGRGWHSYEVQIGKVVIQLRRRDWRAASPLIGVEVKPRLLNVFIDHFGRWA